MEIRKPMEFDKIQYSTQCRTCKTKVNLDNEDLHYMGDFDLYWVCPTCHRDVVESIWKLKRKKVIYYKSIETE